VTSLAFGTLSLAVVYESLLPREEASSPMMGHA
jgi:hypothetical protein